MLCWLFGHKWRWVFMQEPCPCGCGWQYFELVTCARCGYTPHHHRKRPR